MSPAGDVVVLNKRVANLDPWHRLRRALEEGPIALPTDQEFLAELEDHTLRRRAHELACVRSGRCPDCGSPEWHPAPKRALVRSCARCGAHFSIEGLG